MGWAVIGKAIAGGAQAWNKGQLDRTAIRMGNAVRAANAAAENRVRAGQNALTASVNTLNRFQQSLSNKRALSAGGEAVNASLVNAARQDRAMLASGFESSIQEAEAMGQAAAMAGFNGAAGSVVDEVDAATALRYSRAEYAAERYRGTAMFDAAARASAIQQQTQSSLNNSLVFDNLDYGISVAQRQAEPNIAANVIFAAADAVFGSNAAGPGGIQTTNNTNESAAETSRLARQNAEAALARENETEAETARLYRQVQETPDNTSSTFSVGDTQQVYSKYLTIGGT